MKPGQVHSERCYARSRRSRLSRRNCGAVFEALVRWSHEYPEAALRKVKEAFLSDRLLTAAVETASGDVERPERDSPDQVGDV
jgi:hypothetical protein